VATAISLSSPFGRARHIRYVDALIKQIPSRAYVAPSGGPKCLESILGGARPPCCPVRVLNVFCLLCGHFVSHGEPDGGIHGNNASHRQRKIRNDWRVIVEGGVGRISMGLQSTNDDVLVSVGRGRQGSLGLRAAEAIRKAGFKRMNVDLIFALPARQWRIGARS